MKRIGGRYKAQTRSLSFTAESDIGEMIAALKLYTHELDIVVPELVNKSLDDLRTELKDRVTSEYNVSAKDVRSAMTIKKASKSRPRGAVSVYGGHIPLYDFAPDPSTRYKRIADRPEIGVSAQIKRGEARTMFAGSFIADMPSRGMGVYKRVGKDGGQVTHLTGPSIPQMVVESSNVSYIEDYVHRRFYQSLSLSMGQGHQGRIGFGK